MNATICTNTVDIGTLYARGGVHYSLQWSLFLIIGYTLALFAFLTFSILPFGRHATKTWDVEYRCVLCFLLFRISQGGMGLFWFMIVPNSKGESPNCLFHAAVSINPTFAHDLGTFFLANVFHRGLYRLLDIPMNSRKGVLVRLARFCEVALPLALITTYVVDIYVYIVVRTNCRPKNYQYIHSLRQPFLSVVYIVGLGASVLALIPFYVYAIRIRAFGKPRQHCVHHTTALVFIPTVAYLLRGIREDAKRIIFHHNPGFEESIGFSFVLEMIIMAFRMVLAIGVGRWDAHRRAEQRRIGQLMLPHLEQELQDIFWDALHEVKKKTPVPKITAALLADDLQDAIVPIPPLEWAHKNVVLDFVEIQLDMIRGHVAEYKENWQVDGEKLDDELVVLYEHTKNIARVLTQNLVIKTCERHFLSGEECLLPHKCDDLLMLDTEESKREASGERWENIDTEIEGFWRDYLEIHLSDIDCNPEVRESIEKMTLRWTLGWPS